MKPNFNKHHSCKVWAYDEKTKKNKLKKVVRLFRNKTKEWFHVFINKQEIVCTGEHPFYINNKGWVKARDLIENDEVIHYNEEVSKINKIYKEVLDTPEDTYNFEVEDCQLGSGFMNKKTNYLAILPVWGTCIVLFILFIKTIKKEITKKKFYMYMFGCGLFGFLSILVAILTLKLINDLTHYETFLDTYGVWIGFIIGGYIMNIFTFALVNRHYDELK